MALTKVKLQELIDNGEIDIGVDPIEPSEPINPYPVGAIYMSVLSTSPATLFGGTWQALGGNFLIGVNGTYSAGATGGAATHTLTENEMPQHKHEFYVGYGPGTVAGEDRGWGSTSLSSVSLNTGNAGSGYSHNNMPPYLAVYMWKRTA